MRNKITWKAVTSARIDTGALRKALPDVAAAFTKGKRGASLLCGVERAESAQRVNPLIPLLLTRCERFGGLCKAPNDEQGQRTATRIVKILAISAEVWAHIRAPLGGFFGPPACQFFPPSSA